MLTLLALTIPDPDPLPLPAAPWLLQGLLLLTFLLHVLAMNVVLGGSLILAVTRMRGTPDGLRLSRAFAGAMPSVVAGAITFGVAPLLFLQALHGRLFFTSAVLMARYWFAVVLLVILAYYGTYVLSFREAKLSRGAGVAIAAGVSIIFLVVAFIYVNNMSLMLRPDRFLAMYMQDGRGVQLNITDPTFVPRYLHMLLGAVAVAGLVVSMYGLSKSAADPEHGRWAMRYGALWFSVPTLVNLIVGVWWMGSLPKEVVYRFMGQDPGATLWLAGGIALGFASLALMFMATATANPRTLIHSSAGTTVLALIAMIIARDYVRGGMLQLGRFSPTTWIQPQWGVIALFFVLLVAALGTVAWMVLLMRRRSPHSAL